MATFAAAVAERNRLMSGDRSLAARVLPDATVTAVVQVKDSRTTDENEAQATDGFSPGSWNKYDVGSAATYPDAAVTFA